ncbi:MAG TPA: ATP-binding protein, partial [Chitinophagaceae bacterium]|nr:ATP-binding protein [Chitinophagaceae bacterium]
KVISGIKTGNNSKYLGVIDGNTDKQFKNVSKQEILTDDDIEGLSAIEREKGIDSKKSWISFEMGQSSDTDEGTLPCYYQTPSEIVINWGKKSVTSMHKESHSDLANKEFRFEELKNQISFSTTGLYAPTFRTPSGQIFLNKASRVILKNSYSQLEYLGILNSKMLKYLLKNYSNHSIELGVDDLKIILIPHSENVLAPIVKNIIEKQKKNKNYDYQGNEQKEIDRVVYELYGLNDGDIQEIEYWWSRRYPKLARFADTKTRLNVKDQQELQARLTEAIARGENKYCEFKSSLRLDIKKGTPERHIEHTAFKNIAAFLNREGGTLIIGVDDAKTILGLEATDYPTFSKPDKLDEWNKHMDNLIQNYLGNKFHEYLKIQHVPVDGKTVAVIEVGKSTEPAWLNNGGNQEFYIRRTASAAQLNPKEATEYIQEHWKK